MTNSANYADKFTIFVISTFSLFCVDIFKKRINYEFQNKGSYILYELKDINDRTEFFVIFLMYDVGLTSAQFNGTCLLLSNDVCNGFARFLVC